MLISKILIVSGTTIRVIFQNLVTYIYIGIKGGLVGHGILVGKHLVKRFNNVTISCLVYPSHVVGCSDMK